MELCTMRNNSREQILTQWYELVKETQDLTGVFFDDEISSYLILTLDKYTLDISLLDRPISTEYLKALEISSALNIQNLRKVGDRCLIISGLFPDRARKIISVRYYTEMGQQAYLAVSDRHTNSSLFYNLGLKFVEIKDVLTAMRTIYKNRTVN